MKKISNKIFIVIFCCSIITVGLLGFVSLMESSQRSRKDAESTLIWMARDYADKFSAEFRLIEDQVADLQMFVEESIDYNKLKTDPDYLAAYEPVLAEFVKNFAEKRTQSTAGWVYFDPKWSDTPHDVYFVDENDDGQAERQEYIPFSYYDNTPEPNDDKQWWYGPIETGKTFWTNPYEWKLANHSAIKVVSCANPIYIDGEFICVVGTYYRISHMEEEVSAIKAYQSGYGMLFNEKLDAVITPTLFAGTRLTSDNLNTVNNGQFKELAAKMIAQAYGISQYGTDHPSKIMAHAKLSNDWVLGIGLPVNELYADVYILVLKLIISILFCIVFSILTAYILGRYLSAPILKIAEAARAIGKGDFSVKVDIHTKDETKILADSLNGMTSNITELQAKLIKQVYYDSLTDARTLLKFKMDAKELLERNSDAHYAIIKLDIDKFKFFNELYGFGAGDVILKNMAASIGQVINNQTDIFARVQSDEFIIFIIIESPEDIDKKREAFLKNFFLSIGDNYRFPFLFKEGRYLLEQGETDIALAFERVNLAHKLSKQNDTVHSRYYDDDIRLLVKKEKAIEAKMEQALEDKEFQLYLQPKYRLLDESIIGAEALVRWIPKNGDLIYPDEFIPLFERNGFVTKIDFCMLELTCSALREWIDEGFPPITVSVNFSRLHLISPDFLQNLCDIIDKHGVPRKYIEIELTETAMLYNSDALIAFLDNLHEEGMQFSVDDFGTGYSSLGLLKNLPVDVLKLDRSFFLNAHDEYRTMAVIESIVDMTKKLGIHTVAEGVEEKHHVDLLRRLGCDTVQGYYFAKPMPVSEFTLKLRKEKDRISSI